MSFPSGTTCEAVGRGRARRKMSASRTPFHTAVPTAPFSHWRPGAFRRVEAAPIARAFERDGLGDLLHLFEIVQAQGQRIVHLAVHLEHVLGGVHLRPVVVVPDEEEIGWRDLRGELPERSLEVDGAGAPYDELFLAGYRRRRSLCGSREGASEKRGRGAHVDHESATRDAIVHDVALPQPKKPAAWTRGIATRRTVIFDR